MIDIVDKKYGRIIIYEDSDPESELTPCYKVLEYNICISANVVAYRFPDKERVNILKNSFGGINDKKIELFILGCKNKPDLKLDPIYSRFEILDL